MTEPEHEFQIRVVRTIIEPARKRGALIDYWHTPNEVCGQLADKDRKTLVKMGLSAGVSDLILVSGKCCVLCGAAQMAALELKSGDNEPSDKQTAFLRRMAQAGWVTGTAATDEAVRQFVKSVE